MSRLLRWIRGPEGWLTLLLLFLLAVLPVVAFQDARWLSAGADHLTRAALIGAALSYLLARTRLPSKAGLPMTLILGNGMVFLAIGGALPSVRSVVDRLGPFWQWVQLVRNEKPHGEDPLSPLLWETIRQTGYLVDRVSQWLNTAATGGTSSDNLVFLLFIGLTIWSISVFMAWSLYRWHAPFAGTFPTGVFVLVNVFMANQGWGYVATYLTCALLLVVTMNLVEQQLAWRKEKVDYADELPFDVGIYSSIIAIGLVIFTLPLPGATTNPVARAWWNTLSGPWSEVETGINRLFSGLNNPNQGLGSASRTSMVLGASFDPSENSPVFMIITTDEFVPDIRDFREMGEDPAAPVHYWRGLAFETYTGRGWQNSESALSDRSANEAVMPVATVGFITITQSVEILVPRADVLYATNQPYTVSLGYRVQAAGSDDFTALTLRDPPLGNIAYSVLSHVPNLGEEDLRSAPVTYPAWVTRRYLQLPSSLPQRVTDLSRQLTAKASTPYDKAIAIQTYLRTLPYDPKILLPAGDFDAVDYFLFLQKGYCDYFGTTMAVMLRAAGVPARIARGYLPGEYDWTDHKYVVRENRLHAWTEVYFPGFGWVEFEPTPGQRPIFRPPGSLLADTYNPLPTVPPTPAPLPELTIELGPAGQLLLVLVLFLALVILGWTLYPAWEGRWSSGRYAVAIYRRMARYAGWGALAPAATQTPREYAGALTGQLADPDAGAPVLARILRRLSPKPVDEQATRIALAYEEATYGRQPLNSTARESVTKAWMELKGQLWAKAVGRLLSRRRGGRDRRSKAARKSAPARRTR